MQKILQVQKLFPLEMQNYPTATNRDFSYTKIDLDSKKSCYFKTRATFVTENECCEEKRKFPKRCKKVHMSNVREESNIISSNAFYRLNTLDNGELVYKTKLPTYGNRGEKKKRFLTDCAVCSPLDLRWLLSCATLHNFNISKVDIKYAFL